MKIVALSLTQPWASLMAIGAKKIETRSWKTSYRGLVAIHASKGFPKDARKLTCNDEQFFQALISGGYYSVHELPLGAILAVGNLTACIRTDALIVEDKQERLFGNYSAGRYAWVFENVRRLPEPIPAKGALSLWTPEPDVLARLQAFMGE